MNDLKPLKSLRFRLLTYDLELNWVMGEAFFYEALGEHEIHPTFY